MKRGWILVIVATVLLGLIVFKNKSEMSKVKVGDTIPSFKLYDQNGFFFNIDATIGKPIIIYFYPKDETPGCIKEACRFRDDFETFKDLGATVIGISGDDVKSHKKFEEKYNLPFTLLADTKNEVRKLFGVPKNLLFIPGRVTYVIDKNGIIQYIFNSQFNAEKHIENSLDMLRKL